MIMLLLVHLHSQQVKGCVRWLRNLYFFINSKSSRSVGPYRSNLPFILQLNGLETSRATIAGLDISVPKPGIQLKLVDGIPCKIAFERGKERDFHFLALSSGASGGWVACSC